MYLVPAPGFETVERFLQDCEVIVESRVHQPHKDEIEGVREDPFVVLAILLYEDTVIWGIGWLDEAQIGTDDLGVRVLSGELAGPDSGACSNVQNLLWGLDWCFV